jgi:DNA-directed RNA polymerase specialized sigma24 family protein
VAAIPATDERLLRELYAMHGGVLLGYARRLVGGDTVRAEDVVQETLLRAWRHPPSLETVHTAPGRISSIQLVDEASSNRLIAVPIA